MDEKKPLLSTEELNALIGSWSPSSDGRQIDKFFPLRFWYLFVLTLLSGVGLLLNADGLAQNLTADPNFVERLRYMLYFRGWFIMAIIVLGGYVYIKDRFIPLYSFGFLIIALVNFFFDMVAIFPERLSSPTHLFTFSLIARILAIWCIFLNLRNCNNIPSVKNRFNIKLAFAKDQV